MGPSPAELEQGDPELINAGKRQVTVVPGAAFFHHADSFAMIRGGHIDLCVLGALQVASSGDLANWSTGKPDAIPAVGGAMDLVAGVKMIYVITQHCTRGGEPKLVEGVYLSPDGSGEWWTAIYTDLAVIDVTPDGFPARGALPWESTTTTSLERTGCAIDAHRRRYERTAQQMSV